MGNVLCLGAGHLATKIEMIIHAHDASLLVVDGLPSFRHSNANDELLEEVRQALKAEGCCAEVEIVKLLGAVPAQLGDRDHRSKYRRGQARL
jgi:hypothetical protein